MYGVMVAVCSGLTMQEYKVKAFSFLCYSCWVSSFCIWFAYFHEFIILLQKHDMLVDQSQAFTAV